MDSGGFIPESQGEYYGEFSNYNIGTFEPDRRYPLLISFDFNYDPCSLVVCQNILEPGGGFRVIKELQREGGTLPLVQDLKRYLEHLNWKGSLNVTGDASGHKHDTRSGSITDFQIIQTELKIPTSWMNYKNKTNMSLGMSRDLINMAFNRQVVHIDSRCIGLINDVRIAKPKDGADFVKDRNVYKLDLLDAFRYAVHHEFRDVTDVEVKKLIYQK